MSNQSPAIIIPKKNLTPVRPELAPGSTTNLGLYMMLVTYYTH